MKLKFMLLMVMTLICGSSFVFAHEPINPTIERFRIPLPRGGHTKNIRPSTKNKHENANARRQREQEKAQQKREQSRKK